jgi:hypothetical protein
VSELANLTVISVYWWHWLALLIACALSLRTTSVRSTALLYSGAFFLAQLWIWREELSGQSMFEFAAAAELAICAIALFTHNRAAKIIAGFSIIAAAFHAGIALEYSYPERFNLYAHKWIINFTEWGQIFALVCYSNPVYQWQLNRALKKERAKESVWLAYWAIG